VTDLDFSVYDRTLYLRVYPLDDETSDGTSLTTRLREVKALHYEDYEFEDDHDDRFDFTAHQSGVLGDERAQLDQLRSTIIRTRKRRAGRRLLLQFVVAVSILVIIGLAIATVLN
jgi:hypothetical protein